MSSSNSSAWGLVDKPCKLLRILWLSAERIVSCHVDFRRLPGTAPRIRSLDVGNPDLSSVPHGFQQGFQPADSCPELRISLHGAIHALEAVNHRRVVTPAECIAQLDELHAQ